MAIRALRLGSNRIHYSKYDTAENEAEKTAFELRPLHNRVVTYLRDLGTKFVPDPNDENKIIVESQANTAAYETVRFGLAGWTNLVDPDTGEPVEFKTAEKKVSGVVYDVVKEASMNELPPDIIRELAEEINKFNELTEEETKN
jgi:hypothetical protein